MTLATDKAWEKVRLVVTYYNGPITQTITHTITKEDIEQVRRDRFHAAAEQGGLPEEEVEALRERSKTYVMSDEEFQERVFRAATDLATNPLQVAGPTGHTIRILPPWAIRSVDIEVLEPAPSGLVLPN